MRAEDCQILVEEGVNAMLHVFIQPNGRGKHLLCGLDYCAAQVPRDRILSQLRTVLEQLDFAVVTDGLREGGYGNTPLTECPSLASTCTTVDGDLPD